MAEEPTVDLNAMLDEAVTKVAETPAGEPAIKADAPATAEVVDAPTEGDPEPKPKKEEPKKAEPFTPDDALIERAVKAGLTMEVAKSFASKEAAEQILEALEAKAEGETKSTKKGDEKNDDPAGVPEIDISEFTEENGYDPATVKALSTMKAVIESQSKEIASLKKAGETAKTEDFFTAQYNALDKGVRDHMDAKRQSQLKSKFNALEAGYKAQGSKISREDIFKEAVQLAAGDLVSKAAEASKAEAAKKRGALAIARPGTGGGANRSVKTITESDVAKELYAMFTT